MPCVGSCISVAFCDRIYQVMLVIECFPLAVGDVGIEITANDYLVSCILCFFEFVGEILDECSFGVLWIGICG